MATGNLNKEKEYLLTKGEKAKLTIWLAVLQLLAFMMIAFIVLIIYLGGFSFIIVMGSLLMVIMPVLFFIYSKKYYNDIKNNRVDIFEGIVSEMKLNSGENSPCYVKIESIEHQVDPFQYYKLNVGDYVKLRKAPCSKKVVGIKISKTYDQANKKQALVTPYNSDGE